MILKYFFLHGLFSYFSTSKISLAILKVKYEIYLMKPEIRLDLGSDAYVKSEYILMD